MGPDNNECGPCRTGSCVRHQLSGQRPAATFAPPQWSRVAEFEAFNAKVQAMLHERRHHDLVAATALRRLDAGGITVLQLVEDLLPMLLDERVRLMDAACKMAEVSANPLTVMVEKKLP